MKRSVIIFGLSFAALAALLTLFVFMNAESGDYSLGVDFAIIVFTPAMSIGDIFGRYPWLERLFAMLLNALICFPVGAWVGFVFYLLAGGRCKK